MRGDLGVSTTIIRSGRIIDSANKRDEVAESPDQRFVNPYFDAVDDFCWIVARVVETPTCVVEFTTSSGTPAQREIAARVRYHFDSHSLGGLYSAHAASVLVLLSNDLIRSPITTAHWGERSPN